MIKCGFAIFMAGICFLLITGSCQKTSPAEYQPSPLVEAGNEYYISEEGDDRNSGERQSPWRTPGYGARQLSPGDTLVISAGQYFLKEEEDILIPATGTDSRHITIKGERDNSSMLVGSSNLMAAIILSSYLIIEDLEITSDNGAFFRDGLVQIDDAIEDVRITRVRIHHIDEFGINIADINHLTVSNCEIIYTGFGSIGGPVGSHGGWRNVIIENCQLSFNGHYYQGGSGPGPYDRPDGFGIESSRGPIEIRFTTAQHNRGDGLDSKANNTFIHYCVVANNFCDGIKLWAGGSRIQNCLIYGTGDGQGGASPWAGLVIEGSNNGDHFEISNVTIHDNPTRQAYPMYLGYDQMADITVTMRNCIIANGYGAAYFGPKVQASIEYNLFNRPGDDIQVIANGREFSTSDVNTGLLGPGNMVANPLFVRPSWGSQGDYHLQPASPAIDSGTSSLAPVDDLDLNPRPQGNGFDMGAYEFVAALLVMWFP